MQDINGSGDKASKVIDAIEFHTSILALNAAIAAANAGEAPPEIGQALVAAPLVPKQKSESGF